MKLEVATSESEVIQKDDDLYASDTIIEQAGDRHALLKSTKSMDKKEEDISGDASEEVYISPETTTETIKACCPETGIKLTAPSISSVDDTQNTLDDIRHDIPSAEKGDMDSTLPKERQAEIMQTSLQGCSSTNMGDNIANDSKVVEVEHENNEINAEDCQMSSMLLKPDIEKTAEYVSDEMDEEKFSEKILPLIEEKSVEQPFYEESREAGDISAQLKAEDDSSMKTTEIQVENKHIPLTADQEGKSPQDLNYEKERDNEGMSPEDAQQISEEIIESSNASCPDEEAEPTREPQQSYQEILEPSQIIHERANDSKENANDNSTEREVTTSTEEMLLDSSSTIEECSKQIESEIYGSKTIRPEDGAYVDQLADHATIEATEKISQVGLAAVTGPANIQQNDEHQTCQTEENAISEMIKQNPSFPESDLQEKNVISTESISYDNANMTNAALEGDNDERVELKAEETGYSFEEQNVETATREPYSSDQISSTDEISVPFSEKGDFAISTDTDKISSLNDNGNMESIDTETKLDMMQEVENKREIVVETDSDDITEEINDESYMVTENQVENLTNKATNEPGLIVDSKQNISLPAEDQINKLTDVREKAYESVGEKNAIEEEIDSIRSPDDDSEKDSESNNEEIQNDSKPGQSCRDEPDIVKHLEIVNPEIEESKLDQGEQNQENSIHNDAIGPDGDAQSTLTNIEPTSPENHEVKSDEIMEKTVSEIEQKNIENVELRSVRDVASAEENLEDSTNSAAAENNVTSEASINKSDDQNENQSLSVTCVQAGTEAEDTINQTDDSEKEVDLECTEETQSTRDATVESFRSAITDEMEDDKKLESTNADPSQEHEEINNKNSNYDEESNEYKKQEPNEANMFHLEDESKTEEAKTQVYEEGSSSNKEGIRTVEVSQSHDECSKVYEDSIHVIEVEETTDKQHEEQEDRSPYGEYDGVLADQVKSMNAGMDSQNENELKTSNSDGVHVQEDQVERESCKYDEMDESDTRKDKEIISQEFEQDNLVNAITSQESSPPIEPLEHNLGAAMDDPTVSQPSEIVDDESLSIEASQAVGLGAEQHIQTNEDPEQENDISADMQIIQGDSADKLQHITSSAIGYENSTTFAEADKHGSADHLKIVDCKDDEHAENLQESESENQGLATKEVDTAIEADKDDNFDQLPKDLQHNNDAQNFENEGAQKDGQQALLEAGSDVEEMNANPMELSEKVQNDGGDDEEGVCDDTAKTVPVTDPKIEGDLSTGIPSQSGKLDQEINADNPVTSRDEGTGESSEAMQVVDIHEEVSTACRVSPKEVVNQVIPVDAGTDIQQENESNTAGLDCKQDQEDQRGHEFFQNSKMDESHPEKDIELINQGFEQDSISSEMPCQETSATIEALRQDIGTAIDDHTQNESSEIANDKVHIVEVGKEADLETEQHNQTNEEPEHENEISAEQSMDVENRKFIPESELREVNNTENEAINSRAAELDSNTAEDLSGNENTNSEISQTVTKLDEDPKVNTEVMPQHMSIENRELAPESAEVEEEKNTENEAINSRADDLGSNTVGENGNENTNLEISQQEINTEVVIQDMDVENNVLIPESTSLREENNAENEAINSRAADLGSNTVEDLSGTENTHSEISQKVAKLDEDPGVNTEVMPQDMSIKNRELITESAELTEENNTESEAINSRAGDLGSNTVEDSGNENTNLEISQTEISLKENPVVNREVVLQVMDVENHELIPELIELREENNIENEAIKSRGEDLGSNTIEDLTGYENRNSEIPQEEIKSDDDPTVSTGTVPQGIEVENHELLPDSTELREENNTQNEAINIKAEGDLSRYENTNSEMSEKVTNLDEDPGLNTEAMPQDMSAENHGFISESTELREENNTENEAVNSIAKALGSNTVEDLSGNKNTNPEISQKEINLDGDPKVDTEVVLQDMSVEGSALVPESAELTEDKNTENQAINSRAEDPGSNNVEDSGNENTDFEISQKEISLNENPIVHTDVLQDMDVESHELIPKSTELREENSTENEAIKCKAVGLGSNTIEELSGNENTNSEISQKLTNLDEEKNTEVMSQVMDVENLEVIPEPTDIRKENNTENEAINGRGEDLGSNTVEDLGGKENPNSEISRKEINLDEDSIVNTGILPKEMDMENHEFLQESIELRKENNTENEAINSKADDLGSNTIEDSSGKEKTNLEISQKEISLNDDPVVETEGVLEDMDVENHKFIQESTVLIEENNTDNEAINSKAEESDPNTAGDLGGNENTNSEISQKEINLDEDSIVKVNVLQTMEKIQDDEEPENTERASTQEGSQHTLAEERTIDQEKSIDTADTPQLENEEKTCMYDEQIQEVKKTHEQCKFNEINESVSFENKETESQGFEDDCTSKRIRNEQTPMHSEASGQNVGAEMPNQDNEECRIDASEVNNTQEVAEHEEHRNEALVDKSYVQEVICTNASSSGNEMETSSSEVRNDETLLLAEQTTESPPGISHTNNAEEGPELGVQEQSIERNEDDELDSNKPKLNMEMAVNSIEESQHKDDREGIPLDQQEPNHLASQDNEINGQPTQTQSGNGILTATVPSQYIQEWGPNDSKQEEYVSTATKPYIDGHNVDEMTPHETAQTQEKQPVEPQKNFLEPSSPSEATNTTQNKEDCSVTLQDLNEEKQEDSTPEKTTQRELQVSSGFDLCEDLPYIPAVEEVSNTEEYLVPEIQGAQDPQNNEMKPCSCTNNYSHEINSEADQFQNNSQHTVKVSCADDPSIRPISENYGHTSEEVTENQEETKSPKQLIETNNEEQTIDDIIDGHGRQEVKSEMTVEESKSEEDYGPHATSAYDSTEEKLVPAGSVEIVERSSEPGLYKESKKVEDEIREEKDETNEDTESHEPKFYEIDNDADRDGKTLSNTECNTKSDECSITISKDSKEISEEPNIIVTSTSLEGEAVGENFRQNKSGERTENEVRPMEPKMDASMNVPKPDNMDIEKEKQQESANGLECCSTLEPQQGNDRILFTKIEVPENVSSREIDSGLSEAKLKVHEIQSEGKVTSASDVHMDCHDAEKISAAKIIASHICQEIETEDRLKQTSSEHQEQRPETSTIVTDANDKTFKEEVLHDESAENNFMSFDNPAEIICAPEERKMEHPSLGVEANGALEQKQDLKEKHRTMDNSVKTDPKELSSEFGVESSAEVKSDTEDSTLEIPSVKEVCHLNGKRETGESSQFDLKSQSISGEEPESPYTISTDNHRKNENFEQVNELQCEKLAISEGTGNDTQLQTVKNEHMGEISPSNFEVHEAVATDAAGEEEMHNVNTTVASEDHALVQPPLSTTKSCDETKKPLIADEHSANTTFSVSQVSGINNTPPTETNVAEEKVSEQQSMKKVSNQDSNITRTMQVEKQEQLQENYEDLHQSSQLQELCHKDSVNKKIEEPVDTVDVIYNGMNAENFTKEGPVSSTNEVPSLEPVQSVITGKEEIPAEKHNEIEVKSMPPSTIGEKKAGQHFTVTQNMQADGKNAAEEPKTEKEKEDTENEHGEEDSELIPMISEASRDIELKTQNKKSLHILSGMGSKMKNSISKVKKAMACASHQFSTDDVIIKLNKSKKT